MRRRLAPLVLVLAAAAALAACGGSGKSATTGSGPSHAHYVAQANAICTAASRQTAPLIAKIKSSATAILTGGDTAAVLTPVTRLRDAAAANVAKLRALARPAADRAKIARMLNPLAKIVKLIGAAAKDLGGGHVLDAVALIQQAQPLAQRVSGAADALGAGKCGQVLAALG